MSNEVVHLRLINSDEIIGELSGTTNTEILIQKPMLVSEVTDEKTKMSTIVLSKYVLFEDNQVIPFKKLHIVTQTGILDEIKSYYYNSLKYNAKFVEPVVKKELAKVNEVMQTIMDQEHDFESSIVKKPSRLVKSEGVSGDVNEQQSYTNNVVVQNDERFFHPGSNTYH